MRLKTLIEDCGFTVEVVDFVFPMFERWRWLPQAVERRYLRLIPRLERMPVIRKFGVSTLLIARPPKPPEFRNHSRNGRTSDFNCSGVRFQTAILGTRHWPSAVRRVEGTAATAKVESGLLRHSRMTTT